MRGENTHDDPLSLSGLPQEEELRFSAPAPQIEGYQILEKLGEAGQGQVWRAVQLSTGRQVALKVPRIGLLSSKRTLARFEREVEIAARLRHPNIARIYDSGVHHGLYFYVMDLVEGKHLDQYVKDNALSQRQMLELMKVVCEAVQYAHQNGVIHRDLKPSNIIVTEHGHPYLVDFGLAKNLAEPVDGVTVSMDGETAGTPAYMSPEQAAGQMEQVDTRTDVYGLGVVLFALLTGESPHNLTGSRQQVLSRIAGGQIKRPRQVCPTIDRELEWLLLKTLDPDPNRRYASAGGLAEDIHNYLHDAPLLAGPPRTSYRIRKFVARNRTWVTAILVLGSTLVIGLAVSLAMYVRADVQVERTKAISGFLNNTVLRALDPYREQGGEITAVSVLDALSDSLEGSFMDAPLVEAEVRHRLGRTYEANGQYEAAFYHLQRALDIRRARLGDRDPLTLQSMHRLAWALHCAGFAREAEPLFLELVLEYDRRYGAEDSGTISARRMLSWNYMALCDYEAALLLHHELLHTTRRVLGPDAETSIYATMGMGYLDLEQNDYAQAERWFQEALQSSIRGLGNKHAVTYSITSRLGFIYMLQGRYPEAEQALLDAIAGKTGIYGPSHWQTIQSCTFLIRLYAAWDRWADVSTWRTRLDTTLFRDAESSPGSTTYDPAAGVYVTVDAQSPGLSVGPIIDEFHFAHKTLAGDGTISARVDDMERHKPLTKAGIMIRDTLTPASEHASVFVWPRGVLEFQYRRRPRGPSESRRVRLKSLEFPHWIRLTRRGNTFIAEHSHDAVNWQEVRSQDPNRWGPVEIHMHDTVHLGLAVASWDAGQPAEARISNVVVRGSCTPDGPFTTSEDIALLSTSPIATTSMRTTAADGMNASAPVDSHRPDLRRVHRGLTVEEMDILTTRHGGSAGRLNYGKTTGTYTIMGSGVDIWNTFDQFHFAWKRLTGDGAIVARVDGVQHVNGWTKAGVMMRSTLSADSEHVMVLVTPSGRVGFQRRPVAGGLCQSTRTAENTITTPHWIKLVRTGNEFKARHSADGFHWQDLKGTESADLDAASRPAVAEIRMGETVYVGLAITSHVGPFIAAEAKMSDVAVTGHVEPAGEFLWSEDIGFRIIALPKK